MARNTPGMSADAPGKSVRQNWQILQMKAEIAALRSGTATEYPDGVSPKKKQLTARVPVKWSEISPVCSIIVVKRKITANLAVIFLEVVDLNGIEPSTSRMRTERSPS